MSLCSLVSSISSCPLSVVKYKAGSQNLLQLVCRQVFWALSCLGLGLLPSSSDSRLYVELPLCAVSKVEESLDRQWWLLNLCQVSVSQTDYTNTAAFS